MWSFEPFCSLPSAAKGAKLHITELLTLAELMLSSTLFGEADYFSFADAGILADLNPLA